ncbi:hypothetical protein M885DRAFT_568036 [Pelagophyceae sp. CCMP2097]|nr:hypothetical protein M885DRAFT_568036 [Pelagophyceae sp. CCMP2097]
MPFFLVEHTFESKSSAAEWLSSKKELGAWTKKCNALGFHNWCFMPSVEARKGEHMHCLWEGDTGKTEADMQTMIDGYLGPSHGVLTNNVECLLEGDCVLPFKPHFGAKTGLLARLKSLFSP